MINGKDLSFPLACEWQTPVVLDALQRAHCHLAELDRIAAPAVRILTQVLQTQEIQNNAAIAGISATQQDLYECVVCRGGDDSETKTAARYAKAMTDGWGEVRDSAMLPLAAIIRIRQTITDSQTKWRNFADAKMPTAPPPPQVPILMTKLEKYMHENTSTDPLVRMAVMHRRFCNIRPFDSGNGGTGRIVNILFLIKEKLLCAPILYLSGYINQTRTDYYHLLHNGGWQEWLLYMLRGIATTAQHSAKLAQNIIALHNNHKRHIDNNYSFRNDDLLTALFYHPYIKAALLAKALGISRAKATIYLESLTADGILQKMRPRRRNYYINLGVMDILFTQPKINLPAAKK